jgi:hypothetical protein
MKFIENHCIIITIHYSTWLVLKLFKDLRKCLNYTSIKYFNDKSDVIPEHTMTAYGGVDRKLAQS